MNLSQVSQPQLDSLVLLAQHGNLEALELLYQVMQPLLLSFALRLCCDRQMAMDSVQDAWLCSIKTIVKMNDPRVFKSWMFRAVKWKVIDMQRANQAQQQIFDDLASFNEIESNSPAEPESKDQELLALIKDLPADEQEAVYLFYLNGLSIYEISIVQKVPLGTVKSRMNRARNRLKQHWSNTHES